VRKFWGDQGFAGRLVGWTRLILGREPEIVRRDPGRRGFQAQPKRWVTEHPLSWIGVAERCYGNAVAERFASILNTSCFAGDLGRLAGASSAP
jgi:hypothetical protein